MHLNHMIILDHTPADLKSTHNIEIDINEMNAGEFGALAFLGATALAAVGITTVAAPTVTATGIVGAGACGLVGYQRRHGHLPFMGDKQATPVPTPGVVTNAAGTPVAVASI